MYELRNGGSPDFTFYGGAREFVKYQGPEAMIHGPAETGKTISALYKLHICACKYSNASIVIARKTLTVTYATVLQTFLNKVLDEDAPVEAYGGMKPEWFDYPTGSRIWITGLDKSGKVLSAEHDIIYVNQAEELTLDDWETLTTRTTGRAGNMPYSQTIGDCNPSYPGHWMYHRSPIRMFYSKHRENPTLYEPESGEITTQGKRTMGQLEDLTGVRRKRLLEGKPAQAEGVVYEEWDDAVHLIYEDQLPDCQRYIAGVDWGYVHPGVMGVFGFDGDGAMYLVKQVYHTKRTIDWWVEQAQALKDKYPIERFVCDPSEPAYIAAFNKAHLTAVGANNAILPGIGFVQQRLKNRRLFVVRDSLRQIDEELKEARRPYAVEQEFGSYVWADSQVKEIPIKKLDDGMDMTRYATMYVDFSPWKSGDFLKV